MRKFQVLAERLRKRYGGNHASSPRRLPNLSDIATHEGFSLSTVQHAIQELKRRGYIVAKPGLGTFFVFGDMHAGTVTGAPPPTPADAQRVLPLRVVGFDFLENFNRDGSDPFFRRIQGILAKEGLGRPWLYHNCKIFGKLLPFKPEAFALQPAFGTICYCTYDDGYMRELTEHCRPLVSVDRDATALGVDSLIYDCRLGALMATTWLLDHGHKTIAYFGSSLTDPGEGNDDPAVAERFDGFVLAHKAKGRQPDPTLCFAFKNLIGREGWGSSLQGLLQRIKEATAIVAYDENIANHLLLELSALGVRVPQEVSVVAAGAANAALKLGGAYFDSRVLADEAWTLLEYARERSADPHSLPRLVALPAAFEPRETALAVGSRP